MCDVCVYVGCIYFRYLSSVWSVSNNIYELCVWCLVVCGLYLFQMYEVCMCGVCVAVVCIYFRYMKSVCVVSVCVWSVSISDM